MSWYPWKYPSVTTPSRERFTGRTSTLFSPIPSFETLRLMVDAEISDDAERDELTAYLMALVGQEPIQRFWFSQNGAPDDAERISVAGDDIPVDWISVTESLGDRSDYRILRWENRTIYGGFVEESDSRLFMSDTLATPDVYIDEPNCRLMMRDDILNLLVAEAANCHFYITNRPTLFDPALRKVIATQAISSADAVPLIGLYLRLQGIHVLHHSAKFKISIGRKDTYWIAVSGLAPNLQRWSHGLHEQGLTSNDWSLRELLTAVVRRLERILEARDRLLGLLAVPQDGYVAEDILAVFDQICFWMMGALDALALVVHQICGVGANRESAGWQKEAWRNAVKATNASAGLNAVLDAPAKLISFVQILTPLRNTIHDQALVANAEQHAGQPTQTVIEVPRSRADKLLDVLNDPTDHPSWGIQDDPGVRTEIRPGIFVEKLIPEAFAAIEEILGSVEDQWLGGPRWSFQPPPPPNIVGDPRNLTTQQRVLWQMGLR